MDIRKMAELAQRHDLTNASALSDFFEVCRLLEKEDFAEAHRLAKKVRAMSRPTSRQFAQGAVKLMMAMSRMSAARAMPAQKRAKVEKRSTQSRSMKPKKEAPAFQSETPARLKS